MPSRRSMLSHGARVAALLVAAGLLPVAARATRPQAAFDARSLADAVKALGGSRPAESPGVTISGPDIAENGAAVPIAFASTLPGVQRLLLLVEKNPAPLAAVFDVSSGVVEPLFNTRVKMNESSMVYAVAMMSDGKAFFAQREIKVTLGGCAG